MLISSKSILLSWHTSLTSTDLDRPISLSTYVSKYRYIDMFFALPLSLLLSSTDLNPNCTSPSYVWLVAMLLNLHRVNLHIYIIGISHLFLKVILRVDVVNKIICIKNLVPCLTHRKCSTNRMCYSFIQTNIYVSWSCPLLHRYCYHSSQVILIYFVWTSLIAS